MTVEVVWNRNALCELGCCQSAWLTFVDHGVPRTGRRGWARKLIGRGEWGYSTRQWNAAAAAAERADLSDGWAK
jgi:hypothetical protein